MAPVVSNISPTGPSTIIETQTLGFDVTGIPALQRVFVFVAFPGMELEELAFDGTNFTEPYASLSTRNAITDGHRYLLRRGPVWPDSPAISVYAVDNAAAELDQSWPYTLVNAPTDLGYVPVIPIFPVGPVAPTADSGFAEFDQDYFLRLMPKVLDPEFVASLKAGQGYEQLEAYAKMFARVSTASYNTATGLLAAYARGGSYSEGVVEFYRTSGGTAVTVKRGSVVSAKGGRYYRTLEDAVFTSATLGPITSRVRAIFPDWQHNASGAVVTPAGVTIPGEVDKIHVLVEDPPLADLAIKVRQITDFTGGAAPMLDLIARSQNLSRNAGETDQSLSYRIRNLPDNLSPASMWRNADILLDPWRVRYEYWEPFNQDFQTAYDVPDGLSVSNVFTYDDPRPRYFPAKNWYSDKTEQWGTFYINLGKIQTIRDFGGCYDDTAADSADCIVPITGGQRAVAAYDLPDSSTYGTGTDLGLCYDGRDIGIDGLATSISGMMQSNRAAGIVAGLQQEGW